MFYLEETYVSNVDKFQPQKGITLFFEWHDTIFLLFDSIYFHLTTRILYDNLTFTI